MKTNKQAGRLLGMMFLLIVIIGGTGVSFRGLSYSLAESVTFLQDVFDNSLEMRFSILLDIIASALGLGVSIVMFPLIKRYNGKLAYWYFGLWIIQFAVIVMSNVTHLSLLSLSKESLSIDPANIELYRVMGRSMVEEYFWAHLLGLIVYGSGAMILFYTLFMTKLVPRFFSVWGFAAVGTVFTVTWLQVFDIDVNFAFYMQNGAHMITFTIWLLIKGFNEYPSPEAQKA